MEHQKWKKITLPAGLSKCYANAETIVATCHGGQAIVWEWDGIARELTMGHRPSLETNPPPYKLFGGKPGVIFHPFEPRSLFLVWFYGYSHAFPIFDNGHQLQYGNDLSPACTFFVVRYERNDDGVWTPTEHFQHSAAIPLVGGESEAGVSDVDLSLDCRKVDSNGTFSLCFLRSRSRFKYPADYWARFTTTIQCFNVLTQKFLEVSYQKGPGDNAAGPSVAANNESGTACDKVLPVTRLWNGQMYRVTFDYGDETQDPTVDSEAPGQGVGCFKPRITYDEGWQTEDVQYFECMDAAKNFTDFTLFVDDGLMVSCCRQGYYIFTPNADEDDSWISPSRLSTTVTLEPVDQPELSPPQVMAICHCYAQPQLEGLEYYDPNPRPVPTAEMFPNLR